MHPFSAARIGRRIALGLVAGCLLAACTTPSALPVTVTPPKATLTLPTPSLPAPRQSPSPMPIPPRATAPSSPTSTPTATLFPTASVEWPAHWGTPAVLQGREGTWSPVADEYLFFDCDFINLTRTALVLASAPDFITTTLTTQTTCQDFTWSPDGQSILYSNLPSGNAPPGDYSNIAQIQRDGSHPHKLGPGNLWWLNFGGWMENGWLIYTSYHGGGHIYAALEDLGTGEVQAGSIVHGSIYPPHAEYLPAVDDFPGTGNQHLLVISPRFPSQISGRAEGNFTLLPEFAGQPVVRTVSLFEGWWGESNQILAFWGYWNPDWEPVGTHLLLWNVDSGELRLLAPHGVGGIFSPDGAWLAYLTNGPATLDDAGHPLEAVQDFSPSSQSFVQLMAMENGKVSLSLPVLSTTDPYEITLNAHRFLQAGFSPDSRFLAFFTPGPLQRDGEGRPVGVDATDPSQVFIQVLEVPAGRVVWSAPADPKALFAWAPDSQRLVYRRRGGDWQLLDMNGQHEYPLLTRGGEDFRSAAWSFDGRYLSLAGGATLIFDTHRVDSGR